MKINKRELGYFIAGILTIALIVVICELSKIKEENHEGSHGVYDHAESK